MLKNKNVCLIGGSSDIIGTELGSFIDGFDTVVRANCHWPVPKCLERKGKKPKEDLTRHIGRRTDVLFHSGFELTGGSISDIKRLIGLKLIVFNGREETISDQLIDRIKGDYDFGRFYNYDRDFVPTTGFSAFMDILKLHPKSLHLCGFNFYVKVHPDDLKSVLD